MPGLQHHTAVGAQPDKGRAGGGSGLVRDDPIIYGKGILFLGGWEKGKLSTINH